ncbi:hypothetical protein SAY87_016533 [Trapa incisa]|uniref:Small nuclear ribonucleoprotein E n=1 Tax=Trapa incisa TaxID=236973 RepID=A0AAN7LHL8_9MYRT|nr:hypothetical protein SAY87_016533 [Trapa incisa]
MATTKVQRIMTQPINLIFRFLQSKARIQIWLFEQKDLRIEGRIIGFDEYMNLVLDDAEEVNIKKKTRKTLDILVIVCRENLTQRGQHNFNDEHYKGTLTRPHDFGPLNTSYGRPPALCFHRPLAGQPGGPASRPGQHKEPVQRGPARTPQSLRYSSA